MKEQICKVHRMLEDPDLGRKVGQRLGEFASFSKKTNEDWFSELCFCILTANASAKGGIKAQNEVGKERFLNLKEKDLAERLKQAKYRFPNVRAKYIVEARKHSKIKDIITGMPSKEAREWLVENVKGIGMKEASHFLRNTGRTDVGILDKHIIRSLGLEVGPMTEKRYEDIELTLNSLAKSTKTNLAELDLYLWYGQTGEILK